MSNTVQTKNVEFIEFAVRDLDSAAKLYERMGFTCVGNRNEANRKSRLYMQGDIRFVLTASSKEGDPAYQFTRKHGDGVLNVGYGVSDSEDSYQKACALGARALHSTQALSTKGGKNVRESAIHVYGDVNNVFVSYDTGAKFEELFPENAVPTSVGKGKILQTIDHITVNVEKGQLERWRDFYKEVFGFHVVRYFDIRTERTGLLSYAMRNDSGRVTMPFNEPTDEKSQIQEFIDTFHGAGVQHIALHTSDIVTCLDGLNGQGFKFLTVPDTYYDAIPKRVPNVKEDLARLKKYGILVDGSANGYLLQIFTENVVGPFFFEFIQRKGDNGFGDGNFRALFEAIERDQIRRGVLT